MTTIRPVLLALCLATAACGASSASSLMLESRAPMSAAADQSVSLFARGAESGAVDGPVAAVESRQLIRTGNMSVAVDDFAPFRSELESWLAEHGGFVANTHQSNDAGQVGWASLTIRVPAEHFDALVGFAGGKAEVRSLSTNTQDVTEQWTDLTSRLENARRTETRLAGILELQTATLADVLAVERELSRVRGEIESMEGRLRVLDNQIDLATLTLDVAVNQVFVPETVTFGSQAKAAFEGSLQAMIGLGRYATLAGIASAPWLAVFGSIFGAMLLGIRRLFRR